MEVARAPATSVSQGHALKETLAALVDRIPVGWGGQELGRFCSRVVSPAPTTPTLLERTIAVAGVRCPFQSDVARWSGNELFILGRHYEPRSLTYWVRACAGADAVLDVGANAGLYTAFALAAQPDLPIVAVEPDPANLRLLEENTEGSPRVTVLAGCLVADATQPGAWVESPASGGYAFQESAAASIPAPRLFLPAEVRHALGGAARVLVKLDVEGQEGALLGAAAFWQEIRPWALLVEIAAPDAATERAVVAAALKRAAACGLAYTARRLESLLSLPWLRRARLANWIFEQAPLS